MKKIQSKKKRVKKKTPVKKPSSKKALPKKAAKSTNGKVQKRSASKEKIKSLELVNFKATKRTHSALVAQANKFAKGNLSAWLRYAGLNHRPAKNITIA